MQVAGGSGITPMLQVASEVLRNPADKTEVSLIFANQTEKDIILREEIDEMAAKHKNFKVCPSETIILLGCMRCICNSHVHPCFPRYDFYQAS